MKRLICLGLAVGLTAAGASAQSTGSNSSRSTSVSSTGSYYAKGSRNTTSSLSRGLDNTKIYHWDDGQRATPTGHEAAPIGGEYQSLRRQPIAERPKEDY